ncbi:glycosyltransferase [Aliarcobacter cryaerophilus]|jgi:glycosyltransferase involved in cell wall biosynthesis|uniref:Glycosyltransferase n=5 Tax=Arcobacteraceae TaxID=2808963 RepID=A0A1V9VBA6_9BACT|nr:glycosyltransferase [Aliarcobacter cryaerophilus]OQA74804.1 MAG: Alpha-galactosylglucosyldiacylglycerol synthase [Candidatus Dependentiae bacterium ADurb.Bin246]WNL12988.1 glycosyltransferase [Arcobacter sp. AZ-2023]WPD09473.1 glycosyltransferase [Arcobacter sp. DSM 115954]WPD11465.1 glycosyltransferase [Arcobacter sp. DSM 115960]AYJ77676.1 glycosyltransferase, family 1 [Aliarcobacter cryaerophilus D2610]
MKQTTVYYKISNTLINNLKHRDDIKILKKPSFLTKLFSKKRYPDIYFHSGELDENSIEFIKNSKFVVTNSFSNLNLILAKTKISHEKIKVIYPSVDIKYQKPKELKEKYKDRFSLTENTKIIFFTAKNFKTSGVKEFLQIVSNLSFIDFKVIIAGAKQQLAALEFTLPKYSKLEPKIILLDESKEKLDELYLISDVFLLPSYNKNIASSVIKAMFCKCVVFSTMNNDAKEIIDVYATMENPNDPSTAFKIDAILFDENELKKIKKQNRNIALEMSLDKNIEKFNDILTKI